MESWRLGRRPELDALRGVAVLLVVICHSTQMKQLELMGAVGVAMFFALSGFLITALLLEEVDRVGQLDLLAFYRRRAIRLLPALVVLLAVLVTVGFVAEVGAPTPRQALPAMLYVQNFVTVASDGYGGWATIGHTWSLSVEEQFYLVFPLLLLLLAPRVRRRTLTAVLGGLAGLSLAVRFTSTDLEWRQVYFGTTCSGGLLLLGAATAAWATTRPQTSRRPFLVIQVSIGLFALAWIGTVLPTARNYMLVPPFAAVLTVLLLALLTAAPLAPAWAAPRSLVLIGQRSYGLYLWHYPLMYGVRNELPDSPVVVIALLAAAWVLTLLSWHLVEQPVMRWHRGRNQIANDVANSVSGVAVLSVPSPAKAAIS